MKKAAFVLYIVSVLLISGLARAATLADFSQAQYQSPVLLEKVGTDGGLNIYLQGTLPNPCYGQPSALLTQENETTLTLHLSSPSPKMNEVCASPVQAFSTEIQIPLLVHASKIHVDEKTVYLIKVEGYAFSMQVPGAALLQ